MGTPRRPRGSVIRFEAADHIAAHPEIYGETTTRPHQDDPGPPEPPDDENVIRGRFPGGPTPGGPEPELDFWNARPALAALRATAHARLASPQATLGITLARVVAATPPGWRLPAIIGGPASLNLFVGIVGDSGVGKGASIASSEQAFDLGDPVDEHPNDWVPLGTGQGVTHAYMAPQKDPDTGQVVPTQIATRRLFIVDEVDQVAAHARQTASTLLPTLRQAWSGETLGHYYADSTRRMIVPKHTYRMCLVAGIQPARAGGLLDDSAGGTPQRFLWLPAGDQHRPDTTPELPPPWTWGNPAHRTGMRTMGVCDEARDVVIATRKARLLGEGDPLDSHLLLCRLKVAAALALLDSRGDVTTEDWDLSAAVMRMSAVCRSSVVSHLARAADEANRAKGRAEADRAGIVRDSEEDRAARRVAQGIRRALSRAPAKTMTVGRLRNAVRPREYHQEGVDRLAAAGEIDVVGSWDDPKGYTLRD
jgi:hypothetical protein